MQLDSKGRVVIGWTAPKPQKRTEYMCSQCGKREIRSKQNGRPEPGKCPKSPSGRAHRWVKNREVG